MATDSNANKIWNGQETKSAHVLDMPSTVSLFQACAEIPEGTRKKLFRALGIAEKRSIPYYLREWLSHALFGDFSPEHGTNPFHEGNGQTMKAVLEGKADAKAIPFLVRQLMTHPDYSMRRANLSNLLSKFDRKQLDKWEVPNLDESNPNRVQISPANTPDIDSLVAQKVAETLKAMGIESGNLANFTEESGTSEAESAESPTELPESKPTQSIKARIDWGNGKKPKMGRVYFPLNSNDRSSGIVRIGNTTKHVMLDEESGTWLAV